MANTIFNGVIRLRKDTEANFDLIKDSFIPQDGEVCLVVTESLGIRAKIGDGVKTFAQLQYEDERQILEMGYYNSTYDCFFREATEINIIPRTIHKLYMDVLTNEIYRFNGNRHDRVIGIAKVDTNMAGLVKLYSGQGSNVDGSVTQKGFTDSISKINFAVSETEEECLVLSKPW